MPVDLPAPAPSKESDIPDAVKRARAIANGEGVGQAMPSPDKRPNKRRASAEPPRDNPPPTRNIIQVTIDGTDFNLTMPCCGVDVKNIHGQGPEKETETLALATDRYSQTRFAPKMGACFRITQPSAGMTYAVTYSGFSFDVGDTVIHAFVITTKQPTSQPGI